MIGKEVIRIQAPKEELKFSLPAAAQYLGKHPLTLKRMVAPAGSRARCM